MFDFKLDCVCSVKIYVRFAQNINLLHIIV